MNKDQNDMHHNSQDPLLEHDHDGIQEYDNPLPSWWLVTFFTTIIFGFLYWIHYEFGGAPTQLQELQSDMVRLQSYHQDHHALAKTDQEEELKKLLNEPQILAKGQKIFTDKCAACHGHELQGLIGPNLVDDYWIHGKGGLSDLHEVVQKGIAEKGMPAWETMLKEEEIQNVIVFVYSKRGSHPDHPKAPQGNKVVND